MDKKGFSLIELMIVVAIIAIIAAIAIPSLLAARISANEASATQSLRTIHSAQVQVQAAGYFDADGDGNGDYASTLAQLYDPLGDGTVHPIDVSLSDAVKSGYNFVLAVVPGAGPVPTTFTCQANPQSTRTGRRYFFVDESGAMRFSYAGAIADATQGSPLGG